jgi:hypothetical protein
VTGAVPVDVKITIWLETEPTVTLPNDTFVGLTPNTGFAAFNCRAKLLETPPALAVRVTAWAEVTEETVAMNPALVALAGTITAAGTATAGLLLVRPTLRPPLGAGALNVTVQASVPVPVIVALLQESTLGTAVPPVPVPVPLRLRTAVPPVEELLPMVRRPVATPVAAGSN